MQIEREKSEISETLQDLTLNVNSAAKNSLINSPFPLIIMETDGNIIWKSSKFNSEFMDVDINSYMNDLSIELRSDIESREDKKNRDIVRQITIGNRIYKIIGRYVDFKNKDRDKKAKRNI